MDKKLTHKTLTNTQKLFWFTKLAVKKFCFDYSNQKEELEETKQNNEKIKDRNSRGNVQNSDHINKKVEKMAKDALAFSKNKMTAKKKTESDKKGDSNVNTTIRNEQNETKVQHDETATKHTETGDPNDKTLNKQNETIEQNDEAPNKLTTQTKTSSESTTMEFSPSRMTRSQTKNSTQKRKSCDMPDGTNGLLKVQKVEFVEEAKGTESKSRLGKVSTQKTNVECESTPKPGDNEEANGIGRRSLRSSSSKFENAVCLPQASERAMSCGSEDDTDEDER